MTIRNRELSQFGSFIYITDNTKNIAITTETTPYVGIGTTNPQEKLDVTGNVNISGNLSIGGNFDYNFSGSDIEGDVNINTTGIITAQSFVNDEGVLAITDRWDKDGSVVYNLNQDIGIGLSNPSQKLSINGNISAGQFISTVTTGTSPFQINSSTEVTNLNASLLRGGVPGQNINSNDIVTLGATQTLTNKTLTLPTFGTSGVTFNGSTSGSTNLRASSIASGTLFLPTTNGTLVSTGDTGVVTSNMIADLNITNVDVATNASISYSKLNLSNSIANADLAGGITNNKLVNSTISGVSLGSDLAILQQAPSNSYILIDGSTGITTYNGRTARTIAVDATSTNTANKVVVRDGSGNFSANTITLANNLTANSGTITGNSVSVSSGGLSVTGNINATGVSTFAGITTVTGTTLFSKQLNVSGVSTFAGITTVTGTTLFTQQLNVAGVSTFAGITTVTGTTLFSKQLNVSGVSTFAGITTVTGTTLFSKQLNVSGVSTFNDGVSIPTFHLQDQKTSGTSGGTFTSGDWRTRTLNTTVVNTITEASVSSNTITLSAGTYEIDGSAPAYAVDEHQIRFQNTTTGISTVWGTSEYADNGSGGDTPAQTRSIIKGRITITSNNNFQLQHRCVTTGTFGNPVNFGGSEVYSDLIIRKIS